MSHAEMFAGVVRSLDRARALDGLAVVADLYDVEVDNAARGLRFLLVHPDHVAGMVPADVMEEINRRYDAAFGKAVIA
ncbi:MAG: hypothetical protein ACI39C_07245 [Dietzia sp.]